MAGKYLTPLVTEWDVVTDPRFAIDAPDTAIHEIWDELEDVVGHTRAAMIWKAACEILDAQMATEDA